MASSPRKIAYLFGAGATHAELLVLDPDLESNEQGLLISDVSKRVMFKASLNADYVKGIEVVSGVAGSLNIELLITLIENSKIPNWSEKTDFLKRLIRQEIESALPATRTRQFCLHKGLLELHSHAKSQASEELIGLISLNYDSVLDLAYRAVFGYDVNYCLSRDMDTDAQDCIPLLKLHGSFNWTNQQVLGKRRDIEIIPLGSSKSYLHPPYGFIWNRALDVLAKCDSLRLIGCSLSPNDVHLVDLLFKGQLERRQAFDIETIGPDEAGDVIKSNYGFFPTIKRLSDLGVPSTSTVGPKNPFKTWLAYKATSILTRRNLAALPHLRKAMI
jgi:hypothetical protein